MKHFHIFLTLLLLSSCSSYSIKTEIEDDTAISKLERIGVIFRLSKNGVFNYDESYKNLSSWVYGYKEIKKIVTIADVDKKLSSFSSQNDRFFQITNTGDFLKFKSIGSVKMYMRNNEEEIKKIISDNKLDSLIVYEVDSVYSAELQFVDFDSLVTIFDSDFNILLLDHQKDSFDIHEFDKDLARKNLLDKICNRFVETMIDIKYLEEK